MSPAPRPIPQPAHDHTATYLETDEDVLAALKASLARPAGAGPFPAPPTPVPGSAPQTPGKAAPREPAQQQRSTVKLFRPTQRTPMAVLTVFDDGTTEGQDFRLRDGRFVIGRTEGELVIPQDGLMSSRHVEIARQTVGGQPRWVITDLQSTNGLFVRVLKTVLADRSEFLVGNGRYQFLHPAAGGGEMTTDFTPAGTARNSTQAWGEGPAQALLPTLVELVGSAAADRLSLVKPEYWIGTDAACAICRPSDPFCEPRHCRVSRDDKGRWQIENNKSLNGLWFRLPQIVADGTVQFQLGEQRFRLRVGG